MGLKFNSLASALVIFTAIGTGSTAIAQTSPTSEYSQSETLADRFDEVFFTRDKDFSENRSFGRQLDFLFGFGTFDTSFVDNEINADTKAITVLYKEALLQQGSSTPAVRTRDLPNPYDTSILQSPPVDVNSGVTPTE
ncbi:MAG: hypothetical protein KME01_08505 [Chroococcus sp. CMT-3BRIN-NPC107]|jgi:hypothetical protein|nr:hypothetical protein [Chroococcus sp. CMT-3BRIN-NPC107]